MKTRATAALKPKPKPASDGADESGKSRTTISLPGDILNQGMERKKQRRAASFSNYVEILIAEDIASARENREAVPA